MSSNHDKDKIAADAARFIEHAAMQDPPEEVEDLRVRFDCGTVKNPRYDHNEFAKYMMEEEDFATPRDTEELLIYSEGVYKPHGATYVRERIDRIMDGMLSTLRGKSETIGHITSRTYVDRDVFDADDDVINLDNGLYHASTGDMSAHTPKYMSLNKSGIKYDPSATCPAIDKYIREVVAPEHVQTIYEMVGYALCGQKNLKRAFILEGPKNSGKSVLIGILESMISSDAITNVSPLTTSQTVFGAAEYYGKRLNLVDDLGDAPIENTGVLKSIISSGKINAQFKNGQPFDYIPRVLCVFATNKVPITETDDEAFASRFMIIPFPNKFEGEGDDTTLITRLVVAGEMSGFFNKCMDAISEVRKRGGFTQAGTLADRVKAYRYSSKPVERFLDDMCVFDDMEAYVMKDTLFQSYREWSRDNGIVCDGMGKLTTSLSERGCVIRQVRDDHDDRKRAYIGVNYNHRISDFV